MITNILIIQDDIIFDNDQWQIIALYKRVYNDKKYILVYEMLYNNNIYFSLYKKTYNKEDYFLYMKIYFHYIRRHIMTTNISLIHESVFLIIQDDV